MFWVQWERIGQLQAIAMKFCTVTMEYSGNMLVKLGHEENKVHEEDRFPCAVCGKGVGVNSIQCTDCPRWFHIRCSRIKGRLSANAGACYYYCNSATRKFVLKVPTPVVDNCSSLSSRFSVYFPP